MNVQYNEIEYPPDPRQQSVVLALDSGSPVVSVAVGVDREVVAEEALELKQSSSRLMSLIDSTLERATLRLSDVRILLGLRGPGSFTGLRVGMATLQGLTQALQVRVGTLSTLDSDHGAVDEPRLASMEDLLSKPPRHLIGYGISKLRQDVPNLSGFTFTEPGPLAGRAIEMFEEGTVQWGLEGLKYPLYQRPPSAIVPDR
jgi:hypothetical protein